MQLGAALQGLKKHQQSGLNGLAFMRQAVQKACAVKIAQGGNARRVGLRLQIAPFGQLGQRCIHLFHPRHRIGPDRFRQHLIRAQLQPVLPFGGGKHIHDAAVEGRLFGTQMPEELGCGGGVQGLGLIFD